MAEIVLTNKMSAKYNLIGSDTSDVYIESVIGTYVNSEINIDVAVRAELQSDVLISSNVVYSNTSEILIDVIPKQHVSVPLEAFVNPHNKMSAIYEIVEAPYTELEELPIKDTFVTQNYPYNTINYGMNNSVKVGTDNNGENKTFFQFDLSEIPLGVNLRKAVLKLYYTTYNGQSIDVHRVLGEWSEYGLTYNSVNFETILTNSTMIDDEIGRFIEIDISEIASAWVMGVPNNGLMLTSSDGFGIYRSKESEQPPELVISYYRSGDYEITNSNIQIDAEIKLTKNTNVLIDADVKNDFATSEVLISMFAHQPDEIYNDDVDIESEVNQYEGYSDALIEVKIVDDALSEVQIDVEINSYEENSDIDIECNVTELTGDGILIDVEITLYQSDSDINLEVGINGYERQLIEIEAEVIGYELDYDVDIEAEIVGYEKSNIFIDATVISYESDSNIMIEVSIPSYDKSEIFIETSINQYESNFEIDIEVDVPIRFVDVDVPIEAGVLGYGDAEVLIDMYPRVPYISDIRIEVRATPPRRPNVYVYMI